MRILCFFVISLMTVSCYASDARIFYDDDGTVLYVWQKHGGGDYPLSVNEMKSKLEYGEDVSVANVNYNAAQGRAVKSAIYDNGELSFSYEPEPDYEAMAAKEEELEKIKMKSYKLAKAELEKEGESFAYITEEDLKVRKKEK